MAADLPDSKDAKNDASDLSPVTSGTADGLWLAGERTKKEPATRPPGEENPTESETLPNLTLASAHPVADTEAPDKTATKVPSVQSGEATLPRPSATPASPTTPSANCPEAADDPYRTVAPSRRVTLPGPSPMPTQPQTSQPQHPNQPLAGKTASRSDVTLDCKPAPVASGTVLDGPQIEDINDPNLQKQTLTLHQAKTTPDRAAARPAAKRPDAKRPDAKPTAAEPAPKADGPAGYRIISLLGQGAMGVVFKAQQTALGRLTAMKMVRSGIMASADEMARFRIEAEAVARLQHPNIVQIYEVGEQDGLPFFSLEYVDGGSLADRIKGEPIAPDTAVTLVEKLARAVFYAHQRGIIHRDLKPANILMTADGQPKVTDFGLAKFIEDVRESAHVQSPTVTGAVMGTPSYMAPEQAQGHSSAVGPPADIYALGAILYDLLTGRPPFRGTTVMDTLKQVCDAEPVPPRRVEPKIPVDLDTICLRCLAKDPASRYATAWDLAEDLRAYQVGEPIRARPTPGWERAWKWTKRRPAAAGLLAVSCLAVLVLMVGGFVVGQREHALRVQAEKDREYAVEQEKLAKKREAEADEQRRIAEKNFRQANENFRLAQNAVDQLTFVAQKQLVHTPRLQRIRRDVLSSALGFYEQFVKLKTADPELRWDAASAQRRLGQIQELLGETQKASAAYRQAQKILGELAAAFPDEAKYRHALGGAHLSLAVVLQIAQQPQESEKEFRQGIAILSKLKEDHPRVEQYRRELAGAYNSWGSRLLLDAGKTASAETTFRKAIELFTDLCNRFPANADYQLELARAHSNLGTLLQTNDPAKALEEFAAAKQIQEKLVAGLPSNKSGQQEIIADYRSELGRTLNNLGALAAETKNARLAATNYQQAIKIFDKLVNDYPHVIDHRHQLALAQNNLGKLLFDNQEFASAETLRARAREQWAWLIDEAPSVPDYAEHLARSLGDLAIAQSSAGKFAEAESTWKKAIALQNRLIKDHPASASYRLDAVRSHLDLGISSARNQNANEAESNYRLAIQTLDATKSMPEFPGVENAWKPLAIMASTNLAMLLAATNRPDDAITTLQTTIPLYKAYTEAEPKDAGHRSNLAAAYGTVALLQGQRDQHRAAREMIDKAITEQKIADQLLPKNSKMRDDLCTLYLRRLQHDLELDDHTQIRVDARNLLGVANDAWPRYVEAAGLVGQSITLIKQDPNLDKQDQNRLVTEAGDITIALLQRAVKDGFRDAKILQTESAFAELRSRPEFRKLIDSIK